ncbi:GNAT family N-acetyltransferase [Staphylococcus edaphicus]|uniref:GNAT family N-acetyltransferase n=1 Tax=Staphylococcus edaphicus TaxID=1955013 RepID=A0A2C6WKD6_9STAP|nr:GNAT family N-acetyltransferase [Staphylococcus edaphicus]PHK48555.1 GNAT family N-acetyltransferase [Staphylococcus edaphicus]UQW81433.1 GNAT family N-acetyltransferase [Staphylococcus edaphicus]
MDIKYEYQFDINDVDELIHIYHGNQWLGHNQEEVITLFNTATHVIIAKSEGKVIGFARAMSDGVFNAAIYDVMVDVAYQSRGIGYKIVHEMLAYLGELSCIHLIATTGNESFYEQLGFRKLKTGMAVYTDVKLKDEYTV